MGKLKMKNININKLYKVLQFIENIKELSQREMTTSHSWFPFFLSGKW